MLDGRKLLQLRPVLMGLPCFELDAQSSPLLSSELIIAVDELGAGIGEYVLVGHGSRVRDLTVGPAVPTKDLVLAIVDGASWAEKSPADERGRSR